MVAPSQVATELVRLRDARVLEYAGYGDPRGVPVIFFHGFIGSHHQARFAHEAAVRNGVRLIAPNRPGVGRSTAHARKVMADVVPDIEDLTTQMGIERFSVIGASGGGPYALACLARLPGRVRGAMIVSGLGPLDSPQGLRVMKPYARLALRGGRLFPLLTRCVLALRARHFRRDPEAFLNELAGRWARCDQELMARPEIRALFLADLHEVLVTGQGAGAMAHELGLYFRWGFALEDIRPTQRVHFWHGHADLLVPPAMCRVMADRLPAAEVTLCPGGHFMILDRADEVLRRAIEVMAV
jgi:pimeloyl-ACP methyl ester carboxylesterase